MDTPAENRPPRPDGNLQSILLMETLNKVNCWQLVIHSSAIVGFIWTIKKLATIAIFVSWSYVENTFCAVVLAYLLIAVCYGVQTMEYYEVHASLERMWEYFFDQNNCLLQTVWENGIWDAMGI